MESESEAEAAVEIMKSQNENIFSLVFGDSDSDDGPFSSEDEAQELEANRTDQWVKVDEVEGLWHCSHFLSTEQLTALSKAIVAEGWFAQPQHNQAMRFGDLPDWALELCGLIRHSIRLHQSPFKGEDNTGPLPKQILERDPLFDQMIANSYQPGEGIKAHVDLMRFEDGIAIVSLESTCVMSFAPVVDGGHGFTETDTGKQRQDYISVDNGSKPLSSLSEPHGKASCVRDRDEKSGLAKRVDVLLKPGDLIVSYGPARYLWTHGIDRSKDEQVWFGETIEQHQRISVTLRRLCPQRDTD